MPRVTVVLKEGRTIEQKKAMMYEMTEAIARSLDCNKNAVSITIIDVKPENLSKAGVMHHLE